MGDLAEVRAGRWRTGRIRATGRGRYQRTHGEASGFPRGALPRQKRVRGVQTGDQVRAEVPAPLTTAGPHVGRVAVRRTGRVRVGQTDGSQAQYGRVVQRADGYAYALCSPEQGGASSLA